MDWVSFFVFRTCAFVFFVFVVLLFVCCENVCKDDQCDQVAGGGRMNIRGFFCVFCICVSCICCTFYLFVVKIFARLISVIRLLAIGG